jgi:hypothetical protein
MKTIIKIAIGIIVLVIIVTGIFFVYVKSNDPDKQEREKLRLELKNANNIDECKNITEKIIKLKPEYSGDSWIEQDQFYGNYVAGCISGIAIKQNNQALCSDKKTNEEICTRAFEVMGFSLDEHSAEICINEREKDCLLGFLKKAEKDTIVNVDCSLFGETYDKDECFEYLATVKLDPNICLEISSDFNRKDCMHYFAFRENDIALCDYGDDSSIKACKESLNILNSENISNCKNIKFPDCGLSPKLDCYFRFAIFNKDLSVCSKYKGNGPFYNDRCERYAK